MKAVCIEGAKMPTSCDNCFALDMEYRWWCNAKDKEIVELTGERMDWCPLREIEVE